MIRAVCLTDQEISDYLTGLIPEDQCDSFEEHLSQCESCEQVLRRLDQTSDSLTRHLRLTADPPLEDANWDNCLKSLREIPLRMAGTAEAASPVSLEEKLHPVSVYHYELGRQLGRGGMGVVYRSNHPQLHRPVAIKILSASRAADTDSIARFQREMRAAGGLDHPGIVRAVDAGVWQGTYYLVMEFIDGIDLSRLVHQSGPMGSAEACELIIQAAEALQYAHDHQIIHRDIKPSNLMLTRDGTVKILDFGLARLEHGGLSSHDTTTAGRLVGTLDYLSPEQALGKEPIDARSDIYGLGATLFRLLTGRPPHGSSHNRPILQYLQELTSAEVLPPNHFREDLPKELCLIAERMLARDPDHRPESAAVVADLLRPFADRASLGRLANQVIKHVEHDHDEPGGKNPTSTDPTGTAYRLKRNEPEAIADSARSEVSAELQPTGKRWWNRFTVSGVAVATFLFGLLLGWQGVTLWIQSGDAAIRVESEVDNVSLQLLRDGKVAKRIEVHPEQNETRVRVGKYELRIEGATDHVQLDQESLWLMRGDRRIVRITRTPPRQPVASDNEKEDSQRYGGDPIADFLSQSEKNLSELKQRYADDHPVLQAAIREHKSVKAEMLRIAAGESADAQTSKGRTYEQWSDIVVRETDPSTVVDGVSALAILSAEPTHVRTFQTLMKVAQWNESQGSSSVSADYINFLNTRSKEELDARGRYRPGRPRDETSQQWEQIFPQDQQWRLVTDAIVSAIRKLPREAIEDCLLEAAADGADAAKRMVLLDVAKRYDAEHGEAAESLVQSLCGTNQSPGVRALANHVWLGSLAKDAGELQRQALLSDSQELARAVLVTLLIKEQFPFGRDMGVAAGRLLAGEDWRIGTMIRDLALRAMNEGKSFRGTQEHGMLESMGAEILLHWKSQPLELVGLQSGMEAMQMLAAGDLLDGPTRNDATLLLHDLLQRQLQARRDIDDPSEFDDSSMWIMYVAGTLSALEGRIPPELEQHRPDQDTAQAKAFQKWADGLREGSADSEQKITVWLVQFPIPAMEVLFEVAGKRALTPIPREAMLAALRRTGRSTLRDRTLEYVDPALAVPYAASHSDQVEIQRALSLVLHQRSTIAELRLKLPLELYQSSLLMLAQQEASGQERGYLLRLAQIGGADSSDVRKVALQRISARHEEGSDDQPSDAIRYDAGTEEFCWMTVCLANIESLELSTEESLLIGQRMIAALKRSYPPSAPSVERGVAAALKIFGQTGFQGDPDLHIVRSALGERIAGSNPPWRSSRSSPSNFNDEEYTWNLIGGSVPKEVASAALLSIARKPPADQRILELLTSKRERAEGRSRVAAEAREMIRRAITAVESAIEADGTEKP